MKKVIVTGIAGLALLALAAVAGATATAGNPPAAKPSSSQTAIFAGGRFWCMEPPFEQLPGVLKVTAGYTGGRGANPTYDQVTGGGTGHAEAVLVTFDPARISYQQLLDTFWRNIDPTDAGGQFIDRGDQYRAAIFYFDAEQRQMAEASKLALEESWRFTGMFTLGRIVTEIAPAGPFYPAEEEHQDYYKNHPLRYRYHRWNSGRDTYLEEFWGKRAH